MKLRRFSFGKKTKQKYQKIHERYVEDYIDQKKSHEYISGRITGFLFWNP